MSSSGYEEIEPDEVPPDAEVSFVEWVDAYSFGIYFEHDGTDQQYHITANVLQAFEKQEDQ